VPLSPLPSPQLTPPNPSLVPPYLPLQPITIPPRLFRIRRLPSLDFGSGARLTNTTKTLVSPYYVHGILSHGVVRRPAQASVFR
jgi:hypothetical protein